MIYLSQEGGWELKNRIKQIRKDNKLTQVEFGERIGVKGNTVTNYETGLRNPTDAVILSICREFGVNKDWLLTGKGDMYDVPEDEVATVVSDLLEESNPFYDIIISIMKSYKKLDDKSQAALNSLIQELMENMKRED